MIQSDIKNHWTARNIVTLAAAFSLNLPFAFSALAAGQATTQRSYTAGRAGLSPPAIDGSPADPAWQAVEWQGDFIQREPYEGKRPSQATAFKIIFDDENLYVAVRAFDAEPVRIERRMSRRDNVEGDWVAVDIDSYFDKRTAFRFVVNAAGVKQDLVLSNDGDDADANWNPIWNAKTAHDGEGWTAEMRIPLSQLRFANTDRLIWGLQVHRNLFREDEHSVWQFVPRDASGWVHQFGELRGLDGIKPSRQVELSPYVVGRHGAVQMESEDSTVTVDETDLQGGLDGKIGVTNDLTMSFTINPDFGQVEADPSVINLTAYETHYEEKRPFFIEGRNILSFPIMIGDGDFSRDNLFYTRRIGGPPSRDVDPGPGETVRSPENTSIIGAFKLTGKTRSGISIGLIDSVTAREFADVTPSRLADESVEPLTNYFGMRLQKDFDQGKTFIGAMMTATNRDLHDSSLEFLPKAAYTGGIDFSHSWRDRTYFVVARAAFSHVRGSEEAMLEAQESSLRYFQRPDATHVDLDPERRSLGGHGGTAYAAKFGGGHLRYMAGLMWRSPGLELNDMGYLRQADVAMQWIWAAYRIWEPFWILREVNLNFNQWRGWDFNGANIFDGGNVNMNSQLKNQWWLNAGINRQFESLSPGMLRGGPSLRLPGGWNVWQTISTDARKKLHCSLSGSQYWGDHEISRNRNFTLGISFRPSSALSLSASPSYSTSRHDLQYVETADYGAEKRHVMGRIIQKTLGITGRLDLSLTPDLSIQFYGQPFVSAGDYSEFKRIVSPRAEVYSDRFARFPDTRIALRSTDDVYVVDEDGDGSIDYEFENPDFNFKEFHSNLVVRWEYRPGSVLYLVWSQGRTQTDDFGEFSYRDDIRRLFELPPHDVFLIKISHCFNL